MAYIYPIHKEKIIRYRVYYLHESKKIYIGLYDCLEKAQSAYDYVYHLMHTSSSMTYPSDCPIDFKKFISLINFRDNQHYFNAPVYVLKDCFYYYLSSDLKLLFDLKDLFYLTQNKLSKRGNYLYVTLPHRQENLLKRFGILNHARLGKDYLFLNGDSSDFRRCNLHVINQYLGVSYCTKHHQPTYVAKILLDTYLVIGHYDSEVEAAIAYNKAVDFVMANLGGYHFKKNHIPYITKSEYDSLYATVVLSKRFIHPTHQNRVSSKKEYRGVSKDKSGFRASIGYQNKQLYLGIYPTPLRAAQAYNFASLYLYGYKGYTNALTPLICSADSSKIAQRLHKLGMLKPVVDVATLSLDTNKEKA